jgi:indolepyruvate ferredoxin oxidoreductase
VDSEYQVPLSILLDRGLDSEVMSEEVLQHELIHKLGQRLIMAPMKKMCFEKFQRPVYASSMVLGIAFQAGKLPFTLEDLEAAIKKSVPKICSCAYTPILARIFTFTNFTYHMFP